MKIIYDTDKEEIIFEKNINIKYPEEYIKLDFDFENKFLVYFKKNVFSLVDKIRTFCRDEYKFCYINSEFNNLVSEIDIIKNYINRKNKNNKLLKEYFYNLNKKIDIFYYFINVLKNKNKNVEIYYFMMNIIEEIYELVDEILDV